MKMLQSFAVVLLTAGILSACNLEAQDSSRVWILGGSLFTGTADSAIYNHGILVVNGKFAVVDRAPQREELVNAAVVRLDSGQFIMPGMFDLHAHYAIDLFGRGRIDETQSYPIIFLANGVTSTFPAGEMNPEEMRELRIAIDNGERPGPRIFNSGPYFGRWRSGWSDTITVEQINREVDYWAARGVKGFKAKGISPRHLEALIRRAHAHGLTVTGHLGSGYRNTVNPRDAILMGIDRVEHFLGGDAMPSSRSAYASLESMDPDTPEFEREVRLFLERGVFFDATLSAYGYFGRKDPAVFTYFQDERKFFTPFMQRILAARKPRPVLEQFEKIYWIKRKTLKAFYDAGGRDLITLGTDHPSWGEYISGFSVHRELLSFVLSGIPPADALRFATINGARALNTGQYLGSIEPGKFADLVIVNGSPLSDIRNTRNVDLVMKAGRLYDAHALLESVKGTIGPADSSEIDRFEPRGN